MTEELPYWCAHPKSFQRLHKDLDLQKKILYAPLRIRVSFLNLDSQEAETRYFSDLRSTYDFFAVNFCYVSTYQIRITPNIVVDYPYQVPDVICVLTSEKNPAEANMSFNRMLERTKEIILVILEEFTAYKLQNMENSI